MDNLAWAVCSFHANYMRVLDYLNALNFQSGVLEFMVMKLENDKSINTFQQSIFCLFCVLISYSIHVLTRVSFISKTLHKEKYFFFT